MLKRNYLKLLQITLQNTRLCTTTVKLPTAACTTNAVEQTKTILLSNFLPAEQEKILNAINNQNVEQLVNYDISKVRATRLHNWKIRHGPLKHLENILDVEGFGLKVARKFYKSVLEVNTCNEKATLVKKNKNKRKAPFIIPTLNELQREQISTCVSLCIGVSGISWSRLCLAANRKSPCILTHWQHHELTEKKMHLNDLVQRCLYVEHQIPQADCYVMENPQILQASNKPNRSVEQLNINIEKSQLIAILSYALAARNDSNMETTSKGATLFYLRRFLAVRLFNHLVGTERVSTEETMLKLMRTCYNTSEQQADPNYNIDINSAVHRTNVNFPEEMRIMFSKATRYQREFLGQALLLNLAFVRLVLLEDAYSIEAVTPYSIKTNDTKCNKDTF